MLKTLYSNTRALRYRKLLSIKCKVTIIIITVS